MNQRSVAKSGFATRAWLFAAVLMTGVVPDAASLAQAGEWVSGHASRARLVGGPLLAGGQHLVGIQIELEPGWHTYWRHPGDSGVPPSFDWSRSFNVADAKVRFPAPGGFRDPFGTSIGYEDEVVFPVVIAPKDELKPIELSLDLDYAVCADICVPLRAELSVTLNPDRSPSLDEVALVNAHNRKVPRLQHEASGASPMIERSWTERGERGVILHIEARGAYPGELFVEGPSGFYFSAAVAEPGQQEGVLRFAVEVDGAREPDELAGAELTATLVAGDGAIEHSWAVE